MVRENTEGLYHALLRRSGMAARGGERDEQLVIDDFPGLDGEVGWDVRPISRKGSERVIRYSFELAKRRQSRLGSTQKVTCVDKSNVTRGCRLFREVFREISSEFEGVTTNEAFIDAFTMWLVRSPEDLDVVVLPNMFGDKRPNCRPAVTIVAIFIMAGGLPMAD